MTKETPRVTLYHKLEASGLAKKYGPKAVLDIFCFIADFLKLA